jgi:hypothetical protein
LLRRDLRLLERVNKITFTPEYEALRHFVMHNTLVNSITKMFYATVFNFSLLFITAYYSGDQIEKNKIGGACGTYGRWEKCL